MNNLPYMTEDQAAQYLDTIPDLSEDVTIWAADIVRAHDVWGWDWTSGNIRLKQARDKFPEHETWINECLATLDKQEKEQDRARAIEHNRNRTYGSGVEVANDVFNRFAPEPVPVSDIIVANETPVQYLERVFRAGGNLKKAFFVAHRMEKELNLNK